jgi:hypothetical protein
MGWLKDSRLQTWNRHIKDRELFSDGDFLSSCPATSCGRGVTPGSLVEHIESEAFQPSQFFNPV